MFLFIGCEYGFYNQDCIHTCSGHCKDNVACNHVTGQCDDGCAAGWAGLKCDRGKVGDMLWFSLFKNLVLSVFFLNFK